MTERFSASVASRLITCPGSANLDLSIPGWVPPVIDRTKGQKAVGTNRHKWLQEASDLSASELRQIAMALEYYAQIRSRRRFKVLSEETVVVDWLQSKPKTTVDVALYVQDELHIVDWKWGKIPVPVDDNDQLMYYAVTHRNLAPKASGAWLHIIQPPADNCASVFVTAAELKAFMLRAQAAEQQVLAKSTVLNPGDKACQFCPAYPHSRSDKGSPLCPVTMQLLYPRVVDEAEILRED